MKLTARVLAAAACATLLSSLATAQDTLPRRAYFGVAPAPIDDTLRETSGFDGQGTVIQQVGPDATGAALGLQTGDILTRVNDTDIVGPGELVAAVADLRGGDAVEVDVWRDGALVTLAADAVALPRETLENGVTRYESVAFQGGALSALFSTPHDAGARPPVVYFLPGFTCGTIEPPTPNHPYRHLVEGFLAGGFAVYRVEKPGLGDSQGTGPCADIDFDTELDAFVAGYEALLARDDIDTDNVFLFGYSLGGLIAPLVANRVEDPKGMIVYGTAVQNWYDYLLDVVRTQGPLLLAADPGQAAEQAHRARGPFARLLFDRETLEEIAADDPEGAQIFTDVFGWQSGDYLMGRHSIFWNDLGHLNMAAEWWSVDTYVYSVHGESDMAVLNDIGHRYIVDMINRRHPGAATFETIPRTNHMMAEIGTREEYREHMVNGTAQALQSNFNEVIPQRFTAWMRERLDEPAIEPAAENAGEGEE